MATTKRRAGKKAGSKKAGAAKAAPKKKLKIAGKRPAAKKSSAKKPAAKKSVAKKAPAKKAPAKKVAKKSTAKKVVAKKSAAKKPAAKKSTAKKSVAKKSVTKKVTAKKSIAKKAPAKKSAAKGAAKSAPKAKSSAPKAKSSRATLPKPRSATRPSGRSAVGAVARPPRGLPSGRTATSARRPSVTATRKPQRKGIVISGPMGDRYDEILTAEALEFVAALHRKFNGRRKALLKARVAQQARYDAGELPDFLESTREIRDGDWKVASIPSDLLDRRVEITGPVDRKMVVNALNCGANMYMADFEDANSPTWTNNVEGQINMKDRWAGKLDFTDARGKEYKVNDKTATLIVRPRGWHLEEAHLTIDGEPVSGGLFDFGLYFFHNAKTMIDQGTRPYFYIPKLETHQEARLWNDVFVHAQEALGLPSGLIKVTVLIETLPAAFEMDEILYELREHIAGLNAGRWDYIFSFIKKLAKNPNYILPDRSQVVMGKAFLGAYAGLLVKTCHRRGAFAMGGMAAQIPVKNNPQANDEAFARVKTDKEREARDGHDGTWVAHPDLVPVAKEVFDRMMPQPNQLDKLREDVHVTRDDLLNIHQGTKTEEGFRHNIRVGVQYVEAWLRGRGAVPIYNLMEDAATAEISRAQIWQWIKYGVELEGGVIATPALFQQAMQEEMVRVRDELGADYYDQGRFPEAIKLFSDLSLASEFEDFLTVPAYRLIA